MSTNEKFAVALVAFVPFLLILITGLTQGWPTWSWLLFSLLSPAVSALLARSIKQTRERQFQQYRQMAVPPQPAPQPEPPRQEMLTNVSLESAVADYRFLVSGTVYWVPKSSAQHTTHGNLGAVAREAIRSRAAEVLSSEKPDEYGALSERLNAILGAVLPAQSGEVDAWASGVSVTLPEADQKRLHRLAEVRKEEEVWEHERNHERNVREYLGSDVLGDPGRAVVWWLARNNERDAGLEATVSSIEDLRRLTSAAHATDIPAWNSSFGSMQGSMFHPAGDDGTPHPTSMFNGETPAPPQPTAVEKLLGYFDDAVASNEPGERTLFVRQVAQVFDAHGRHDDAAELRDRFGVISHVPDDDTPAPDESHDSPDDPQVQGP